MVYIECRTGEGLDGATSTRYIRCEDDVRVRLCSLTSYMCEIRGPQIGMFIYYDKESRHIKYIEQ